MFRADPGLGHEMKQAIENERDLYTLFSVALEQKTPMDIRRAAANRINLFSGSETLRFIREDSEPKMLEGITHSALFPTTFKSFAKAAREQLTYAGVNSIGLRRRGFTPEKISEIQEIYRYIFLKGLNNSKALHLVQRDLPSSPARDHIASFIKASERGIMKGFSSGTSTFE